MSPIPKPPRAQTPVEKAVSSILAQVSVSQTPMPNSPTIRPLLRQPTGGPLMRAYEQMVADEKMTRLEWDLRESLWAMATLHTPVFTQEQLYAHVGEGHMEDTWYVKKTNSTNEVFLLCRCMVILVLSRCYWDDPLTGEQCEEPCFPDEATFRKDSRCGLHHGQ